MKQKLSVYWSRKDLRLKDNPALFSAVSHSKKENTQFLPIFIIEDYMIEARPECQFGYPSRFFLSCALPKFSEQFKNFEILHGKAAKTIIDLGQEFDIEVFVNEDIHPDFYTQINKIRDAGVSIKLFSDTLTISKDTVTGAGNMYSVFTPFKKSVWVEFCSAKVVASPDLTKISYLDTSGNFFKSRNIEPTKDVIFNLFSKSRTVKINDLEIDIDSLGLPLSEYKAWYVCEDEVLDIFKLYVKESISEYEKTRNELAVEGTSRMSLALAWGLVSARTLTKIIQDNFKYDLSDPLNAQTNDGILQYISELIWREFYKYLYFHRPELMHTEFQEKFRGTIKWVEKDLEKDRFVKWIQGETGYPVVDAAMMELAKTGYMHNRARMIVSSVLTKNLGVDWRLGQEYFRAMLIDLDDASNNGGWQWGASVGADPKPIRIFNPYLQAENYDKQKIYQKKYLRADYFENPPEVLVEHKDAREQALKRYSLLGREE